jgi:hypothetical protein
MSELDFACMQLSIAIRNPYAIERKRFREMEAEKKAYALWQELAKTSTQKNKMRAIGTRG